MAVTRVHVVDWLDSASAGLFGCWCRLQAAAPSPPAIESLLRGEGLVDPQVHAGVSLLDCTQDFKYG